jgi:uncharacterized protein (TIRG00374 family)
VTAAPVTPAGGARLISSWQFRAVIVSALLAAIGYLAIGLWTGWRDVALAIGHAGVTGIGIALLLSLVNYGLRFLRWHAYLGAMGQRVPILASLRIYLAGFALTTTPGKVGELLRTALLVRWAVPVKKGIAAFFSERLSDLLAIVLMALLGLSYYRHGQALIAVCAAGLAVALIGLSSERLLAWFRHGIRGTGRVSVALRHVADTLIEASRCNRPMLLAFATVASIVAWAAEGYAFHLVLERMGEPLPVALAMSIYATAMLAGALSFMPGGLGGAEAVMVALLVWRGLDTGTAVAATLIIRLTTLWFAVVIGGVAVAGYAFQPRRPATQSST